MRQILVVRVKEGRKQGLLGKYYAWVGETPPGHVVTLTPLTMRVDSQINFVWWEFPIPDMAGKNFLIEWNGYVLTPKYGIYIFFVETDDGARLWVNDTLIIDAWRDQPPTVYHSKPMELDPGYHKLRLLYYNKEVFGVIRLGWIKPDGTAEIIPSENLAARLSDHVKVKGLPESYRVELWSGMKLSEARVTHGSAVLDLSNLDKPVDGYFRVYDDRGELVGESTVIRDVWGGDEFEVMLRAK